MMSSVKRVYLGKVIKVTDRDVIIDLVGGITSLYSDYLSTNSDLSQSDELVGIDAGSTEFVARIISVIALKPSHPLTTAGTETAQDACQLHLEGEITGILDRGNGRLDFIPHGGKLPSPGDQAFALSGAEMRTILG